jgi:hypothetical protein
LKILDFQGASSKGSTKKGRTVWEIQGKFFPFVSQGNSVEAVGIHAAASWIYRSDFLSTQLFRELKRMQISV